MAFRIAYLILISPHCGLALSDRTSTRGIAIEAAKREMYWLSVSIQAAFIAYMVCSFLSPRISTSGTFYYTAALCCGDSDRHARPQETEEMKVVTRRGTGTVSDTETIGAKIRQYVTALTAD